MKELKVLLDATEIAVRGPGWPSTAKENDAPNPWSKQHRNLTNQAKILKRDRAEANRLAQADGHKAARRARVANDKYRRTLKRARRAAAARPGCRVRRSERIKNEYRG